MLLFVSLVVSPLSRGLLMVHTDLMNIPSFIKRSEGRNEHLASHINQVIWSLNQRGTTKQNTYSQLTSAQLSNSWKAPSFQTRIADLHKSNWGSTCGKFSQMELSDVAVDSAMLTAVSWCNGTLEGTSGAKCRCTQPSHWGSAQQRLTSA